MSAAAATAATRDSRMFSPIVAICEAIASATVCAGSALAFAA